MEIRPVNAQDHDAVYRVESAAFARADEAILVQTIRKRGEALVELVAEDAGEVVGHVLVSPIVLVDGLFTAAVAPLAVLPTSQGKGVGSALMRAMIALCRGMGIEALFLLGNPDYYQRFGFVASPIGNEYGATDAFMHLELTPGVLSGINGTARYVEAFSENEV